MAIPGSTIGDRTRNRVKTEPHRIRIYSLANEYNQQRNFECFTPRIVIILRKKKVKIHGRTGLLNPDSNYCSRRTIKGLHSV